MAVGTAVAVGAMAMAAVAVGAMAVETAVAVGMVVPVKTAVAEEDVGVDVRIGAFAI